MGGTGGNSARSGGTSASRSRTRSAGTSSRRRQLTGAERTRVASGRSIRRTRERLVD